MRFRFGAVIISGFVLIIGLLPGVALAGSKTVTVTVDGRELALPEPAGVQDGVVVAPVRAVAEALGAQVTWIGATGEVLITAPQTTVKLTVGSREVSRDWEKTSLPVPVRVRRGGVVAPVRFVAEALGAMVSWDHSTRTLAITSQSSGIPERVYASAFPARVAFTANRRLWLLDGAQAGAQPVQVTAEGEVQLVGWSPDGEWLAYLYRDAAEDWAAKPYLWVVRADGRGAYQVDPRPVLEKAAWSPQANLLAYSTQGPEGGYAPDGNLKIATVEPGGAKTAALIPGGEPVEEFAWSPDGQSLVVSLHDPDEQSLRLDRLTLKGERNNLLTLGEAGNSTNPRSEVLPFDAQGFSWSPDGRYLAYYLCPNSPSLAADGVELQVLDLNQPGKPPLNLGTTLSYAEWLAWSPDGSQLGYIWGGGREATTNKVLRIVDLEAGGKVIDCGRAGQVDTMPVWLPASEEGVLFCRGPEDTSWEGEAPGFRVLVPGQRVWWQKLDGTAVPVTSGPANTADCYPSVSPDGRDLFYLRLTRRDSGSLYRQPLAGGPAVELVRNLGGSPGYYGNYYPAWVSIYHFGGNDQVQALSELFQAEAEKLVPINDHRRARPVTGLDDGRAAAMNWGFR